MHFFFKKLLEGETLPSSWFYSFVNGPAHGTVFARTHYRSGQWGQWPAAFDCQGPPPERPVGAPHLEISHYRCKTDIARGTALCAFEWITTECINHHQQCESKHLYCCKVWYIFPLRYITPIVCSFSLSQHLKHFAITHMTLFLIFLSLHSQMWRETLQRAWCSSDFSGP